MYGLSKFIDKTKAFGVCLDNSKGNILPSSITFEYLFQREGSVTRRLSRVLGICPPDRLNLPPKGAVTMKYEYYYQLYGRFISFPHQTVSVFLFICMYMRTFVGFKLYLCETSADYIGNSV